MQKTFLILILAICLTAVVSAQGRVAPNKPFSILNSAPGFVSINELTGGFGLAGKSYPYSKYYFGFTSVTGYQVNREFILGAGIGVSIYDAGVLVPLFLDFRYSFGSEQISPYLFADGGILMKISNFDETKLFINPGVGARYSMNRRLAFNISGGILTQVDGVNRASFVSFRIGGIYKFN